MASKKDTTIFYQNQIEICKKYMDAEQFGRLMFALFEYEAGNDPEVGDDIAIAFEFMSLQMQIDREKYAKIVERNRKNGKKGGRPKKEENPKNPNGYFENPNEDDDEDDDDNENENDDVNDNGFHGHGTFHNVELTDQEYQSLADTYDGVPKLVNKVSTWLRNADNDVPDHYALCIKFAENDEWPKRLKYEPVELPEVKDPLTDDEKKEKMAEMRAKLGGMYLAEGG